MSPTIERRLLSAQLRPLLLRYLDEGIEGEDLEAFDRLLLQLADGDVWASGAALNHLLLGLARQSPPQEIMLQLFADGRVDLVGIKDGQFGWTTSMSFGEGNA